ncbi:hypothetical protein Emag_000629 [Eimeria magna]
MLKVSRKVAAAAAAAAAAATAAAAVSLLSLRDSWPARDDAAKTLRAPPLQADDAWESSSQKHQQQQRQQQQQQQRKQHQQQEREQQQQQQEEEASPHSIAEEQPLSSAVAAHPLLSKDSRDETRCLKNLLRAEGPPGFVSEGPLMGAPLKQARSGVFAQENQEGGDILPQVEQCGEGITNSGSLCFDPELRRMFLALQREVQQAAAAARGRGAASTERERKEKQENV